MDTPSPSSAGRNGGSDSDGEWSVGGTLLAAAHATYASSARRPSDWLDFVESVAHAMAPLAHSFPPGSQPALTAGALTELAKSGVSGEEMASSASGGLTARSAAATFEALLDELYLMQGYRNSHHAGLAASIASGSSLPVGGLSDLRLLSATCYRSLKDLFLAQDPVLEALFATYTDAGGAASRTAYAEFVGGLVALSTRWKRFLFFREDPLGFEEQARTLFAVLDDWLRRGMISCGEFDFIEDVLYSQTHGAEAHARYATAERDGEEEDGSGEGGDEFLLAAWSVCFESLSSHSSASPAQQSAAVNEFYDSVLHLLERQVGRIFTRYTGEAQVFLRQLNRNANYQLPPASLAHLYKLIEHQQRVETLRSAVAASAAQEGAGAGVVSASLQLSEDEERLSDQAGVLFAAFAESAQSQNSFELLDSLQVIGDSWRKHSSHGVLLACLEYLKEHSLITVSEQASLEHLVYTEDAELLAAWEEYAHIEHDRDLQFTKACFEVFVRRVRQVVAKLFEKDMDRLAKQGYALVNAWSTEADPAPQLFSDPMRNEAVGLPPTESLPLAVARFDLPEELEGTLSPTQTVVLRDLCARRDPVLMALLQEHADSGDVDELVDGVERLLGREMHPDRIEGARRQSAQVRLQQQQEANDEALHIFQLVQMLSSLHADGYISAQAFEQLADAAAERRDPVLLAAFAMYKDGLARASPGADGAGNSNDRRDWPELWDTLQRVWGRLQREAAESASFEVALLARGRRIIDTLSASNTLSITNTLYLRDLLAQKDDAIMAALSLHAEQQEGHTQQSAAADEELLDTLHRLSGRWVLELSPSERHCVRVLQSLCEEHGVFSARALDYLLGLVYARDATLAAVFSVYNDAVEQQQQPVKPQTRFATPREEEQEEEEEDDDEDEDDWYDSDEFDDSEEDEEDEDDEEEEDEDDVEERKYSSSGRQPQRASATVASQDAQRRALAELVDTLHSILRNGQRTIAQLNAGQADL